ncbi:MAG: nucleotidyltransferase domain-containing protein [Nanoarchaeota archaeon]
MESKKQVKKKTQNVIEKPSVFENEREMALDFAMKVQQKFDKIIKAVVLFGSQTKNESLPGSDIDLVIIIDDASIQWDMELIAWYREELGKLIQNSKYEKELHVNTIKLTTWWNDLMYGDPVIINILRYGDVLVDYAGFFNPLKILLQEGKIKSTHEAVYVALERSPNHLLRSKISKIGSIDGIFWSMVDSAQAALMTVGKLPPSTEHIPGMLRETFVQKGMLKESYADALRDLYAIHRGINHGKIHDIPGKDIDEWYKVADSFLNEMSRIINTIIESQKK